MKHQVREKHHLARLEEQKWHNRTVAVAPHNKAEFAQAMIQVAGIECEALQTVPTLNAHQELLGKVRPGRQQGPVLR